MAKEIERKFLLKNDSWPKGDGGVNYLQGYLSRGKEATVRVRLQGEYAVITIKGPVKGITRTEFEYAIPAEEAKELLELCKKPYIKKTRYKVKIDNLVWEIDVFDDENKGLILAEIELSNENQKINLPDWVGEEVTGDPRYYNAMLSEHPYTKW